MLNKSTEVLVLATPNGTIAVWLKVSKETPSISRIGM